MINRRSIGFRLAVWYSGVMAAALILFGVGMWLSMKSSIYDAIDNALRERVADAALVLRQHAGVFSPEELREVVGPRLSPERSGVVLRVLDAEGKVLYASRSLDAGRFPTHSAERLRKRNRFNDVRIKREALRFITSAVSIRGRPLVIQAAIPVREWTEGLAHFSIILATSIPVVLIGASFGGYWMSRRALAPVDEITNTARSIGADDLGRRLPVPPSGDELERLSTTLNGMFERLEGSFQRINQFTADASHELRTPLAFMRTTAELALRKQRPEPEYRTALAQILSELERTSGLVENLLLLARADAGARLELGRLDLAVPLREACEQCGAVAQGRGIRFGWQAPDHPVEIEGAPDSLRRVFVILIDNALKYTARGGQVSVDLSIESESAIVWVKDSGIGIAPEDLPRIFDRFYRADKARSSETGGAGLGLAIAKWIVQSHRGEIHVTSTPGEGSIFSVVLPVSRRE